MHPRPIAETFNPVFPRARVFIIKRIVFRDAGSQAPMQNHPLPAIVSKCARAEELLREVSACCGQSLNASAIGRRLGLACNTILHRIAMLEEAGVIRILPSLAGRHPHVLLRDCRFLKALGGGRAAILRAYLTERITMSYGAGDSCVRFFQWEAGRVKRIDLVASTSKETVGFQFSDRPAVRNRDWAPLRLAVEKGVVNRGFLVHCGMGAFVTARAVSVVPIQGFLENLDRWLGCGNFREARQLLRVTSPQPQPPGHPEGGWQWFSKLSLF
jgi:hypothetical protein